MSRWVTVRVLKEVTHLASFDPEVTKRKGLLCSSKGIGDARWLQNSLYILPNT